MAMAPGCPLNLACADALGIAHDKYDPHYSVRPPDRAIRDVAARNVLIEQDCIGMIFYAFTAKQAAPRRAWPEF